MTPKGYEEHTIWRLESDGVAIRFSLLKDAQSGDFCVLSANVIGLEGDCDLEDYPDIYGQGHLAIMTIKALSGSFGSWHPDCDIAIDNFDLQAIV